MAKGVGDTHLATEPALPVTAVGIRARAGSAPAPRPGRPVLPLHPARPEMRSPLPHFLSRQFVVSLLFR